MRITSVKEPATKPVQTSGGHDCCRLAVDDLHIVLQRLESSAPRRASGPVCVTMYDWSTSCKEGGRERARARHTETEISGHRDGRVVTAVLVGDRCNTCPVCGRRSTHRHHSPRLHSHRLGTQRRIEARCWPAAIGLIGRVGTGRGQVVPQAGVTCRGPW